jgi:hypothetical protein
MKGIQESDMISKAKQELVRVRQTEANVLLVKSQAAQCKNFVYGSIGHGAAK